MGKRKRVEWFIAVDDEGVPVIPGEAAFGAEPEEAARILGDARYALMIQAFGATEASESNILSLSGADGREQTIGRKKRRPYEKEE
jgi:hypothetical protein